MAAKVVLAIFTVAHMAPSLVVLSFTFPLSMPDCAISVTEKNSNNAVILNLFIGTLNF
jgi:hypothetical protein